MSGPKSYAERAIDRRTALKGGLAALGAAAGWSFTRALPSERLDYERTLGGIPVELGGSDHAVGHLLRDGTPPGPAAPLESTGVAIVGGGIAGLAAAWTLARAGFPDFRLIELEAAPGGTSRGGANARGAYPLGAHYLPVPGPEQTLVKLFLEDAGILLGEEAGLPVYEEMALCNTPQERLWLDGIWQEGLVPRHGVSPAERAQIERFFAMMHELRGARGRDGAYAFALPVDASSRDDVYRSLDALTMSAWLEARGLTSPRLRWYVDYCCRDDYGTTVDETSAWAGIHYFAARRGVAARAEAGAVLTWPEGNARLASLLARDAQASIACGRLVTRIAPHPDGGSVIEGLRATDRAPFALRASQVICAAPQFVAARLFDAWRHEPPPHLAAFTYAGWMVANVAVASLPSAGLLDAPVAWDNVVYGAPSLGYVVAGHQVPESRPRGGTLTQYWALAGADPRAVRRQMLETSRDAWRRAVVGELARTHPGIERTIERIDVHLWGHGMVRPVPGFVWGDARQAARRPYQGVTFAHSDGAGLSLFENALDRGVAAAKAALRALRSGA